MKILNKNDIRELLNRIKLDSKYLKDKVIVKEGNKYYLISEDIKKIDISGLNVKSYGYLIAESRDGRLLPKFADLD